MSARAGCYAVAPLWRPDRVGGYPYQCWAVITNVRVPLLKIRQRKSNLFYQIGPDDPTPPHTSWEATYDASIKAIERAAAHRCESWLLGKANGSSRRAGTVQGWTVPGCLRTRLHLYETGTVPAGAG